MRFVDWNGSGGLDLQDIATSVAVEEAARKADESGIPKSHENNAGCATMAAFIALPVLLMSSIFPLHIFSL